MASLRMPITPPIPPNFKPLRKIGFLPKKWNGFAMNSCKERCSFGDLGLHKDGILMSRRRIKSLVLVRANQQRFGFNGGGWDEERRKKVLGNLALAIGLTYLTMTDQLGWILDAIVSIWLLAVLIPIVGLGVFFWYAGRDIIQSSCPNCGNEFQVLKSSLDDGVQLCPFCTQPFSVEGNKFVREPTKFSSGRSPMSGQVFNGFSQRSNKGTTSSTAIVDIEAEVKDIE